MTKEKTKEKIPFRGMLIQCENKEEHEPHVLDFYQTHQNGELEHFCAGISGEHIKITELYYNHGDARTPTYAKYLVEK